MEYRIEQLEGDVADLDSEVSRLNEQIKVLVLHINKKWQWAVPEKCGTCDKSIGDMFFVSISYEMVPPREKEIYCYKCHKRYKWPQHHHLYTKENNEFVRSE